MREPVDPRRRVLAGLLAGTLASVGLGGLWLAAARDGLGERTFDRRAMLEARALADTLQGLEEGSDPAALVERWMAARPALRAVRVVALGSRSLVASTVAGDAAAGEPPRRLQREEKPLFDAVDELRRAVEIGASGEGPRRETIRLEAPSPGERVAWAPLLRSGEVTGGVQIALAAEAPPRLAGAMGWWILVLVGGPALVLLGVGAVAPRRRTLLASGALLLAAAVAGHGLLFATRLTADRRASERVVADEVAALVRAGATVSGGEALDAESAARAWDRDPFGEPRGRLLADGSPDEAELARDDAAIRSRTVTIHVGLGLLGLGLLAFVGLGAAARLWQTLVRFRVAYAYVAPAMVGMLLLVFFPFLYGITLSFTNANIYNSNQPLAEIWVGLQNFQEILSDFALVQRTPDGSVFNYSNFYYTLGFTVVWTVSNVAIGVGVGLLLALVLNTKGLKLKAVYRVLLVLPWAVPNYITALIWKGMFHKQFGVVNQVVQIFGGEPVSWFEKPVTSFATVLATNGWLSFPFMMVICLGALQSIPADLYEAARVDGASRWQQFRAITLPSLKPALVPAVILSVIWTFNMFNIIYLVSQGEPAGSTEILITQAYKLAFEQYRYGYAAAYSTVIFLILLAYGTWQNRVTRATEGL